MANNTSNYRNSNTNNNTNAGPGTNGNSGFTKANGFINLYLTQPDGSQVKFGAIPTYRGDNTIGQIHEFLTVKGKDEAETASLRVKASQAFLDMIAVKFVEVADEPKKIALPKLS